jgi:chromosome segregation ATPase
MSTSFSPTQTRDLDELRNHLKWLDEERRKSSRKIADLEQRLAQQGRELVERDRKIQDLEWHIGSFVERVEQLPALESNAAQVDQRLHDLEWQLANLNSQLARLPNADDEQARRQQEIDRAVAESREQAAAEQAEMEYRMRADLAALFDSEDRAELASRQNEHAQTLETLDGVIATLQERFNALTTQFNELTGSLATEVRAVIDEGIQERMASLLVENQALIDDRLAGVANSQREWASKWTQLEENIANLANLHDVWPALQRIEQELARRQSEESRLSDLINAQQNRIAPISERLTLLSDSVVKVEAGVQAWTGEQLELRETVATLMDSLNRNQSEIDRKLEQWQTTLDEHRDTIEQFAQQWLSLSNQYKEARMAVQNFAHWQNQLEQQKRESSELLQLESTRMQSRWESAVQEIQARLKDFEFELAQKWQGFELENEEKWTAARRNEQAWREQLLSIDDLIQRLQQDNRNLIWRVQAAQVDAIKKWPLLLMEEVEKAVDLNPNRRLAPVAADPHSALSVAEAIERGLITIDYETEPAIEL